MKRMLPILLLLLLTASLGASCSGAPLAAITPSPSPVPTHTPVPTPVPVIAVVAPEDYACFWEGIETAGMDDGASVMPVAGGLASVPALSFSGASVILAYLEEPEPDYEPLRQAMQRGSYVYVYAANGQDVPEDIPALTYSSAGAAEASLDAAIAYPPHDTPVRLFGLFSDRGSAAHAAWSAAVEAGRVFVKATYYAAEAETEFAAWLEDRLAKVYPGMLDGIYAETASLAVQATDALAAMGRTDIEVFAAEAGDAVLTKMLEYPGILVSATGANPVRAGYMLRESAYAQLIGILPASRELLPRTFSSATLEMEWDTLRDS
ncbi:MAG: hypothetical protein Q4C13_08335 [Clostridia bacterium]|nr:hypothetical protein [Clostridia bacterium]